MIGVGPIILALTSSLLTVDETCSVPKTEVLTCPNPTDTGNLLKEFSFKLGTSAFDAGMKSFVATCKDGSATLVDPKTGEVKLTKTMDSMPGIMEFQVNKANEKSSIIHARSNQDELLRVNSESNLTEKVQIPSEYLKDGKSVNFASDGQHLEIMNRSGELQERVPLSELFERDVKNLAESETQEAAPTTEKIALSQQERFVPVDYKSQNKFQDLFVYDRETNEMNRYSFALSRSVDEIDGPKIKDRQVYISKDGNFAVTYEPDGSARIWEHPLKSTVIDRTFSIVDATKNGGAESYGVDGSAEHFNLKQVNQAKDLGRGADQAESAIERARKLADKILSDVPLIDEDIFNHKPQTETKISGTTQYVSKQKISASDVVLGYRLNVVRVALGLEPIDMSELNKSNEPEDIKNLADFSHTTTSQKNPSSNSSSNSTLWLLWLLVLLSPLQSRKIRA